MNRSLHIRLGAALTAVLLIAAAAPSPAHAVDLSAQAIPLFTISGAGWGHGIGMSQYGAKGFAELGKSGEWIATYYYPGTTIASKTDKSRTVNLDAAANYSQSSSKYNAGFTRLEWHLRPGYVGGTIKLTGVTTGGAQVTATLDDRIWTAKASGTTFTVGAGDTVYGPFSTQVTFEPVGGDPPLIQVTDGSGPFGHGYVRYRGVLKVSVNTGDIKNSEGAVTQPAGRLKLLNTLAMSAYLYGVVPRESPASWPHEALVAQALTARSYAYNSGSELYCTTSSQVYNGHSKGDRTSPQMHEDPRSNAAVDESAGKYVTYDGTVITTYFCSSSGGHTANIEDVWLGTSEPSASHPYRKGVPSPYEGDQRWGPVQRDGLWLGAALKRAYPGVCPPGAGSSVWVSKLVADRAASGHVRRLDVYWSNGNVSRGLAGTSFRSAVNAYAGSEVVKSTVMWFNGFPMTRIAGSTRYDTAVQVSRAAFSTTTTAVVLASGEKFADAVSGSALAGVLRGSLLLTGSSSLPESVQLELARLKPSRIYVVGGPLSISDGVLDAVKKAVPAAETTRVAGADRYATAARVAGVVASVAEPQAVFVINGSAWADAAAASALAYAKGYPILLTPSDRLGAEAEEFLAAHKTPLVLIAGGFVSVAGVVDEQVRSITAGQVERFAGSNRYDTACQIAEHAIAKCGFVPSNVYVASGVAYADALTGGVVAGSSGAPLLLIAKDACPGETATFLRAHRDVITQLYILGGLATISERGANSLDLVMMN